MFDRSAFQFMGSLALLASVTLHAEPVADHLGFDDNAPQAAVNGQNTPGNTREQMLVQGLRDANLDPRALDALERAFRDNPRPGDINETLAQLTGQNKDLFQPGQVEDLKRLFNQTLGNVKGEPGKELAQAVRKVREAEKGAGDKAADAKGDAKKGELDPRIAEMIEAKLAKGLTPQDQAMMAAAQGLNNPMLGLLSNLLNGKEDGEKGGNGGGDMRPQPPQMPPGRPREDRGGKDKDKKKDEPDRHRGGGYSPPPPSSSKGDGEDKKPEEKKSGGSESPKRPPREKDEEEKKETPKDNSLLDSLKKETANNPPPKKSPLAPMGGAFGGGMGGGPFGGPNVPGGGGGGGMMGGGMGGGMMGGGGGMGGGSSFSGDVFASVGADGAYPGGGGIAGGSGFSIVREVGFGSANGGGSDGGSSFEGEGYAAASGPASLATISKEVNLRAPAERGMMILERYQGFAGQGLCRVEENQREVGLCEGLALRRNRGEFSRALGRKSDL